MRGFESHIAIENDISSDLFDNFDNYIWLRMGAMAGQTFELLSGVGKIYSQPDQ